MKKVALTIALFIGTILMAQPPHHSMEEMKEKKEKMEAMRVAFITEELDLTADEAQKFWPVFNERNKKVEALRKEMMEFVFNMRKEEKTIDDLSDAELKKMMQKRFDNEKKIAEINEQYHAKIVDTIGLKKTAKLYMSEMRFQRKLIEHSRGRKGEPGQRGSQRR
ncbi:MAG: hypothetical protein N4A46_09620 [Schleiferiaceae bacterium]|jgi:hypothetical protein|nr:hypothetical protein [Schleiferiaceae bacterium]